MVIINILASIQYNRENTVFQRAFAPPGRINAVTGYRFIIFVLSTRRNESETLEEPKTKNKRSKPKNTIYENFELYYRNVL